MGRCREPQSTPDNGGEEGKEDALCLSSKIWTFSKLNALHSCHVILDFAHLLNLRLRFVLPDTCWSVWIELMCCVTSWSHSCPRVVRLNNVVDSRGSWPLWLCELKALMASPSRWCVYDLVQRHYVYVFLAFLCLPHVTWLARGGMEWGCILRAHMCSQVTFQRWVNTGGHSEVVWLRSPYRRVATPKLAVGMLRKRL